MPIEPPDLGLGPAPTAPTLPARTSSDPSTSGRWMQLALMGLAGGLGPGAGTGILQGLSSATQQRQQQAQQQDRWNQVQYQEQQQNYALEARRFAAEHQARQQAVGDAVMSLTKAAPTLKSRAEFDRQADTYAQLLQSMGIRMSPNWLRATVPYVPPAAKDLIYAQLDAMRKAPENKPYVDSGDWLNMHVRYKDPETGQTYEKLTVKDAIGIVNYPWAEVGGRAQKISDKPLTPEDAAGKAGAFMRAYEQEKASGATDVSAEEIAAKAANAWEVAQARQMALARKVGEPSAPKAPRLIQVRDVDAETGDIVTSLVPAVPGEIGRKPAKEPTQTQYMAGGYAARLEQAEAVLHEVEASIAGMGEISFRAQQNAPSAKLQTGVFQSYDQAARNFINAVLRRESGAAISPSEFANARRQYLPVPGDTPETRTQKKANRDLVFANLKREAGRAYQPPPTAGVVDPAASARKKLEGR